MPAQNRLRLDDEQRLPPVLQPAREQDEEHTIRSHEARPFDRAVEDEELLPQDHVFSDPLGVTARQIRDRAGDRRRGDGLGQAGDGGTEPARAPLNDRLNLLEDAARDHHYLQHATTAAVGSGSLQRPLIVLALPGRP